MDKLTRPFQFFANEMEEDAWFCKASFKDRELYRLLDGLEKLTEALKVVPGMNFGSWEWDQRTAKFRVWKKSVLPLSPVWSLE